ncbi:MAG: DUF167 domain-containing protein [bacterium]
MFSYKETKEGILFDAYIQPNASRNIICGEYNNALKICLTSPPVEGAANEACIKFLSKSLKISKSQIKIIKGEHQRKKQIFVKGVDLEQLTILLQLKKNCMS